MDFAHILLLILLILILIVVLRIIYEVTHPQVKTYHLKTSKLRKNERIRIVFLADLHSRTYGKDNIRLIRMVSSARPDFIILGGDMITASLFADKDDRTVSLLSALVNIAPVFYGPGNHEKKLSEEPGLKERFNEYSFELECLDIPYLADKCEILTENTCVYGLDIDSCYYKKINQEKPITEKYIYEKLGHPDTDKYNILIAHTPAFFNVYVNTDFDLILCGHYHGGVADLPWIGPVISPDLKFRPEHCAGAYRKSGKVVIVTRGIGSHLVNIRLFNRPEVAVINLKNQEE